MNHLLIVGSSIPQSDSNLRVMVFPSRQAKIRRSQLVVAAWVDCADHGSARSLTRGCPGAVIPLRSRGDDKAKPVIVSYEVLTIWCCLPLDIEGCNVLYDRIYQETLQYGRGQYLGNPTICPHSTGILRKSLSFTMIHSPFPLSASSETFAREVDEVSPLGKGRIIP